MCSSNFKNIKMDLSLNNDLLEKVKCPNCFNYMAEEIYECPKGHSVCSLCWVERCPICHIKPNGSPRRNYTLETISKLVFYPCCNKEQGCTQLLKLNEFKDHIQTCNYREYKCLLDDNCDWLGLRSEIKKHAITKHDPNILVGQERTCIWNKAIKPDYEVFLMLTLEAQFYVHRKLKNNTMYWAVQYIGNSEDVILYYFQIQIFTDQFCNRRLTFSEICHDDTKDDIDEITENGFCIAVPMSVLETYKDTDEVVFYKISIEKA